MSKIYLPIAFVAAAALAGCNKQDHTITGGVPDPMANELTNAGQVTLPPAILASKTYRCKDNSLVYIDWLSDNRSATVRTDKNGTPAPLTAPEAGQAYVAEGYSLTGDSAAPTITITLPGKGSQSCKA